MRLLIAIIRIKLLRKILKIGTSEIIDVIAVKPVLSGHLKRDKTKVLMEYGSLMKVESIAECCNTFDLH